MTRPTAEAPIVWRALKNDQQPEKQSEQRACIWCEGPAGVELFWALLVMLLNGISLPFMSIKNTHTPLQARVLVDSDASRGSTPREERAGMQSLDVMLFAPDLRLYPQVICDTQVAGV